ncbi:MAG: exodeoxyribonuclease V subunit alpha [Alphaproteobacteria bacterium]|nr:exodeoxyribonuclease V subunit alpha [Alphaproteobacteria bacterium]
MTLTTLRELGLVGPLDTRFAEALARLAHTDDDAVLLGAALASRAISEGDVGVDLTRAATSLARRTDAPVPSLPAPDAWATALRAVPDLVRTPADKRPAPLVLDGTDLYLERTWAYQDRLASLVRTRLAEPNRPVDAARLADLLRQLDFGDPKAALQLRAAITATYRGFAMVAGGPGTGKTAVVVKLLALLQTLETERTRRPLRIRLAAPTGKAAARMSESIRMRAEEWIPASLRTGLDVQASTIHRMLGWAGRSRFRHCAEDPLPLDLLIVDEASMVDLPLMTKLLDAVPPGARILLLGDPDQLASVEIGSVFADLCAACSGPVSSTLRDAWVAAGCDPSGREAAGAEPAAGDALTILTYTWRFQAGIEELAQQVNAGDGPGALAVLMRADLPDVAIVPLERSTEGALAQVEAAVLEPYLAVAKASTPTEALDLLRSLRVLGAHRAGVLGVDSLNAHLEARVRQQLGVPPEVDWYAGRPVMITKNDHDLKLYNGDVGVVLGSPDDPNSLRVWFETARKGEPRAVPPALLPEHETVFVTTVHKSQGSEYAHVVLVLPREVSPLVTRELLYTGVTRASARVTVLGPEEVWVAGVEARIERMSRLAGMCR